MSIKCPHPKISARLSVSSSSSAVDTIPETLPYYQI
jgi:hypothetical protein